MLDKDTYKKAFRMSKQNPGCVIYVLYDGDFRVEMINSEDMGVYGFTDVAEFLDGEMIWLSKDY